MIRIRLYAHLCLFSSYSSWHVTIKLCSRFFFFYCGLVCFHFAANRINRVPESPLHFVAMTSKYWAKLLTVVAGCAEVIQMRMYSIDGFIRLAMCWSGELIPTNMAYHRCIPDKSIVVLENSSGSVENKGILLFHRREHTQLSSGTNRHKLRASHSVIKLLRSSRVHSVDFEKQNVPVEEKCGEDINGS